MSTDPASLIVATTALIAAAGGIWSSRAGRKDSVQQQEVARQVGERDASWRERGEIITDLRIEADRKQAAADKDRARADAAEQRLADVRHLVEQHEPWDADRRRDQPGAPPTPPLRIPRQRRPPDHEL
jgi:FtsZ-interacting cell division protein ZipA